MGLKKTIKDDWNKLKGISDTKGKLIFLRDYYTIPIIITVIILGLLINFVVGQLKKENPICYVVLVNTDSLYVDTNDDMFKELLVDAGYNMNRKTVNVSKNYTYGLEDNEEQDVYTLQVLAALFMVSDLDVFITNEEVFEMYAVQDAFADLSLLIDSSILSNYELYKYKDSTGQEIVGGVILHNGSKVHEAGYFHDDVIIGLAYSAIDFDEGLDLIIQILSD